MEIQNKNQKNKSSTMIPKIIFKTWKHLGKKQKEKLSNVM